MARTPTESDKSKSETRLDAEQEMLIREVDEAVRQGEATDFAKKYGMPLGIGFIAIMLVFGAFLLWQSNREQALEEKSEELIMAMDELDAGNVEIADGNLRELSEGDDGAAAMAAMLRAGIAIQEGRSEDAAALFDSVADNAEMPAELRDLAAIRSVTLQFDTLEPQAVIDRIGPLAQPDNPYYGSAGEVVAHAYIRQGQNDQAGPLLVAISQNEDVPDTIRGRTRQLAGLLGFDAIENVDEALEEITGQPASDDEAEVELVE